jgi:hypothetical protein
MKLEVKGDTEFDNFVKEKQSEAILETQINAKVEDPADRKKLVNLEKQRVKAEADSKKKGIRAVPGAKETLENIEMQINDIVGKYTAIDGRTADVRARKKAGEEVIEAVVEKDFQSNLEFAKKHSALYGLEIDDSMSVEQITEQYGKEAAASDGFIKGDRIIINKTVAKNTGAVNVGNHELLHGILRKGLKEGKINKNLITDLETKFGANNWSKISNRIKGAGYTTEYMNDNPDEYLTLLSDAIANNEIKFDEGIFTKIGDLIAPILRPFGFRKIGFEDANSTYEFLKEYNRSIHKGALSSAIVKQTAGKVDVGGMKMSKSPLEAINDLIPKNIKTKKEFNAFVQDRRLFPPVFMATMDNGVISNYVKSKSIGDEYQGAIESVQNRITNFDPEATRADGSIVGPEGFGEFIFANTRFGMLYSKKALAIKA